MYRVGDVVRHKSTDELGVVLIYHKPKLRKYASPEAARVELATASGRGLSVQSSEFIRVGSVNVFDLLAEMDQRGELG